MTISIISVKSNFNVFDWLNIPKIPYIFLLQRKCDMYWPKDGTETYGVIQVRLVKEDVMATYTVRTLLIRHLRVNVSMIQFI